MSGCVAGLVVAGAKLGISSFSWAAASFAAVGGEDLQWAFLKALVTGLAIALVAYGKGASPKQSQRDVADATNGAIVWSTFAILVIHGLMTVVQYGE